MAPLELLILKSLEAGPNHGFGITLHVQAASGGLLGVEEGSLYPALHRLGEDRRPAGGMEHYGRGPACAIVPADTRQGGSGSPTPSGNGRRSRREARLLRFA